MIAHGGEEEKQGIKDDLDCWLKIMKKEKGVWQKTR